MKLSVGRMMYPELRVCGVEVWKNSQVHWISYQGISSPRKFMTRRTVSGGHAERKKAREVNPGGENFPVASTFLTRDKLVWEFKSTCAVADSLCDSPRLTELSRELDERLQSPLPNPTGNFQYSSSHPEIWQGEREQ